MFHNYVPFILLHAILPSEVFAVLVTLLSGVCADVPSVVVPQLYYGRRGPVGVCPMNRCIVSAVVLLKMCRRRGGQCIYMVVDLHIWQCRSVL